MNNDEWIPNGGPKSWIYYGEFAPNRWMQDIAVITITGKDEWQLQVNHTHVATFNSWAEARDATPMMIKLHGYESES